MEIFHCVIFFAEYNVYPVQFQGRSCKLSKAHSPVKSEIPKNTRPRHLKNFHTQYIFVSNCF